MMKETDQIRNRIAPILRHHHVVRAGIFGSMVKGEAKPGSDIDILVELPKETSLLDFVALKLELEDALGRRVDLVEYVAIRPLLKDQILGEQVPVLP